MNAVRPVLACICLLGLAALVSGCCCGEGEPMRCTAKLKYTGGEYSKSNPFISDGRGVDKRGAAKRACEDYCYSADPSYDDKYKEWVNKPENKTERERYDKDPRHSKEWGGIGNSSIKRERELCVDQCVDTGLSKSKKKKLTITTQCDDPPKG